MYTLELLGLISADLIRLREKSCRSPPPIASASFSLFSVDKELSWAWRTSTGSSSMTSASGKLWLSLKLMRLAVWLYWPPWRRFGQFLAKCPTSPHWKHAFDEFPVAAALPWKLFCGQFPWYLLGFCHPRKLLPR